MSETKDPISIPEGQVKDTTTDTTSREQQNFSVFTVPYPSLALITPIAVNLESVSRSAAGVVNDAGDALDDVGNTVSSAGYVISSTCDVPGKTMPLGQEKQGEEKEEGQPAAHSSYDEEHGKYATQPAKKPLGGRGLSSLEDIVGGVTGSVGNTVDAVGDTDKSAVGDVTGGLGLGGKSDETLETPKQAEGAKDVMEQKPEDITPKVDEKGRRASCEAPKSNTHGEEVLSGEAAGDEEAVSKAPGSEALKSMAPGEEAAGELAE
ncbi:hypothetical protein FOBRF1_014659 [Fusarium oxysporum]